MTLAPESLLKIRRLFMARFPGISAAEFGIAGGPSHVLTGTSYHLGRSDLKMSRDPYSARLQRDLNGLSDAASAFDITNAIGAELLARLSIWLVVQCRAGAADTLDIREIIYSPDGNAVLTWDRERGVTSFPMPRGGLSHRMHTHISFYRDSEFRDRHSVFERFFTEESKVAVNETDFDVLIWRVQALLANRETVAGGPLSGEENELYATLKRIEAKLDTVATPVSDEQLERVLRKVLGSLG